MTSSAHKTEGVNRTKTVRFYPFVFTGEVPCKEVRTPLTSITFSEERDEETGYGCCNEYQPHAAVDENHYSYYVYDHSGERRVKLTGESEWLDANADLMLTGSLLYKPTLYPSPYLVLSMNEYTKHYYAGAERVAACLGGGGLDIVTHGANHSSGTDPTGTSASIGWSYIGPGYEPHQPEASEEEELKKIASQLQDTANNLFNQSYGQLANRRLDQNDPDCLWNVDVYQEELRRPLVGIPDGMEAKVGIDLEKFRTSVIEQRKQHHDESEYVYYYHSDHLGSASWITDHDGDPVQHLQYLPYGEPYVNIRTTGYSERFTFTGKERDEETGYGYFGARYMDHELTAMWLSVDPMADKYPSISPYAYCAWNPIRLVDPDGNEAIDNDDWYKDEKSRLKWDPSVTKETTLKDGEEYLGKTVLLTNSEGQTVYGDEHGSLHTSVPLAEVNITADASTTETDANVANPVAVPIGAFLWEQLSTAAGEAIEAVATIAWIIPASLLVSGDTRPNQDIRGGHDNNVRKSTKGKHENGDSRRLQDQQGSKGEKMMKGKRPKGYKGPWPPKKKK